MRKLYSIFLLAFFLMLMPALPSKAATTIVLDPGHGGDFDEDLGAVYPPYSERDMTLFTAQLLKAELEMYDDVRVLMTRTDNSSVTLQQRVDYAHSVGADFLYSIHYNATGTHDIHGAEVYISVQKDMYERSFAMAWNTLQELTALGMHPKGVRVRMGRSGASDYYGILRIASGYQMPAAIVEHCYLDEPTDRAFLAQGQSPVTACAAFAHADAVAIAKSLHLKSTALGTDYSTYPNMQIVVPVPLVTIDITPQMLGY